MSLKIVVIGGVAAGMSAASKAKRVCRDAEIDVYTAEEYISYSACSLPYLAMGLIQNEAELVARTPEQMLEAGVRVHVKHEVTDILPEERCVLVKDENGDSFKATYDKLVIATGSRNIVPRLENITAEGVFTVKGIPDIHRLQSYLSSHKCQNAVVIGGGFIGMEMADAMQGVGLEVTMLEKAPQVMSILDEDIASEIMEYVSEHGVKLHCGTEVTGIRVDEAGRVSGVQTDKEVYPADVVILAIGLGPNSALAEKAGIELGFKKGIRVNERMETSISDIYAAGDCAATFNIATGKETLICLGTVANRSGKVAGENAAGGNAVYGGEVGTSVFKIFGKEGAKTGISMAEARMLGIDAWDVVIHSNTKASGYPGRGPITVKLVVERGTVRLLGGQIFGDSGSAKRIDVIAAYTQLKQDVYALACLDMGYAPPFSPVWDPILVAANQAVSKAKKMQ